MDKVKINLQRLNWCLESFNLSLEDLRQESKVNIKKTDDGILLTINQLDEVAKYFNKGMLFFLNPQNITDEKIHSIQFRTINSQKTDVSPNVKKIIERVELQRDRYIGLLEELSIPLKRNWKPNLSNNDEVNRSRNIRSWLGLGEAKDFGDVRKAIEDKGIMVFKTNGYSGKWQVKKESPIRGFSLYYEVLPVIVVKKQASEEAQTFTLIHELAHLLLHEKSYIDTDDDFYSYQGKEKEANEFAGEVLVPDEALLSIELPENLEEYDSCLKSIAKNCCVSVEVILRRLLINKRISQKCYEDYRFYKKSAKQGFKLGGSRGYRHREPLHTFGKPFVSAVFSAYYEKHITLSKASSYLDNIRISDVHKLEKYLVQL